MTHMDDQVAKHIKAMIQRIRRENTDNHEGYSKPHTVDQIIRTLKRGPDRVYGLVPPRRYPVQDEGSGT